MFITQSYHLNSIYTKYIVTQNKPIFDEDTEIQSDVEYESNNYEFEKNKDQNYTLQLPTVETFTLTNLTILDVRTAQKVKETNNVPSFPNSAYKGFVQLITKHHLSDSVANDIIRLFNDFHMDPTATLPSNAKATRKLLDSMQIPHILYKQTTIEYDQIQCTLHHRTIYDAIKELLSNTDIFKYCVFDYMPKYVTNNNGEIERCYGEQYNSEWWGRAQASISNNAKVLSIILYSDATTCDMLGKTSEHPVFLTLGNIPNWRRNKPDAKALLAYLPKIKVSDEQVDFAQAKHYVFHRSFEILLDMIRSGCIGGLDLRTDDGIIWCFPFLSELLGDLPEHHALTLTFNSANCKMPCYSCITPKEEFNNPFIDHSTIQLRTPEMMQHVLQDGFAAEYSLHNTINPFWAIP